MKHKIYSIALVAALCGMVFGGCKKDNPLEGTDYNTIITVKNSDAKTHYNPETHGVEWDEDDQISVTRGSNTFSTFILSDLSDGVATFVGTIPDDITEGSYYGIYPAQEGLSINDDKLNCVAIQPIQTLTNNTFGKGNNTAVGCNNSTTMQFRNVGGLVKIAMKGDLAIKSITITDEDGQKLSGRGTINIFPNSNLAITWDNDNSSSTVTAQAPDQTNGISINGGKWFYIVLPPCTLNHYIIDIVDKDGDHHTKHFSTPITISRRTVTFLGGFDMTEEYKQIRYTNGSTTIPTTSPFLNNAISQVYDNDNNCWVATYSRVITSIPSEAFYQGSNQHSDITSIVIPKSVTSIGEYAFKNCSNLTSINIRNATTFGTEAFHGCTNLTSIVIPNATSIGEAAFSHCTHLSSITLPNITSLWQGTFYECTNLTSVEIPLVTRIKGYAFYHCTSLHDVYSTIAAPTIGENVFNGVPNNALIHLPDTCDHTLVNWGDWPGGYAYDYND